MKNKSLRIEKEEFFAEIIFDKMPLWRGVQSNPGDQEFYPLKIRAEKNHFITQKSSSGILNTVFENYNKNSYSFITFPPGSGSWANQSALKKIAILDKLYINYKTKNILEIGSGTNWVAKVILEKYKPLSYTCVDPTIQSNDQKINIIRDYYPSKTLLEKKFDIILGINVLEHVPDPLDFLINIRKNLSNNGFAILYFPDCENQLKIGDINAFLHEHISYFTKESLNVLLQKSGLKLYLIKTENDLFSVVLTKNHDKDKFNINFNHKNLLIQCYECLEFLLNDYTINIIKMIKEGKKIAFHGATQGLNSYIYLSNLNNYDFDIFDSDINKKGKFLPSYNKPIKHFTDGSYKNMDLIIISAMSFFESVKKQIKQKHYFLDNQIIPFSSL